MTKSEFLEVLTECLTGELPGYEIESNIRYYDEYITNACDSGQAIEDVLDMLGDPRLIARTIIDTSQFPSKNAKNYNEEENYSQEQAEHNSYRQWQQQQQMHYNSSEQVPWYKKLLNIALLILILVLIFMLISVFFNIFFSIGIPIILILLIINLVLRFFR